MSGASYKLRNGNAYDLLKELPPESVDTVLTDPPFGVTRNEWDKALDFDAFWAEIRRIIKPGGVVLMFGTEPFFSAVVASNPAWFHYDLVWCKPQGTDFLNANRKPLRAHESIAVFCECQTPYFPIMEHGTPYSASMRHKGSTNWGSFKTGLNTDSDGRRYPKTWRVVDAEHGLHPTQKPVELLSWLIETYAPKGATVLDPFMGSGSTGVACAACSRSFVGIELDQGYFDVAERRVSQAFAQQHLF